MSNYPLQKASLGVPSFPPRAGAKEPRDPSSEHAETASTSSAHRDNVSRGSSASGSDVQSAAFSHYSVSTLLGISNPRPPPPRSVANDKPKGEMARSLLRMLVGGQKAPDVAASQQFADVHNLIPYGDVVGLLGITVKQCKDFTSKFNVKHDIYLLIRISIDKIMKCTNPQVYKANQIGKKNFAVSFGDVRYFSVKVPKQKSDSRNRIVLELVGFEGPKDFPRLFGKITMHLYEVIQKQSFTETCAMRIRNMVFCTVEVEFMFCYGCFGYGYSHQLKLPGTDPAQAVAYSMFLRVPPPEDRKDHLSNVIVPQHMDYPAFLSPDLNVTVGNFELETPTKMTEDYKKLQRALQEPPRERLEKMKQEYRSLKTWNEKADYLDQLILKKGPKTIGETKVSRFKELVQKIHSASGQDSIVVSDTGVALIDEVKTSEIQKWANVSQDAGSLTLLDVELSQPVPTQEEAESGAESEKDHHDLIESTEPYHPIPTLTITSSTSCPPGGRENLDGKIVRQQISHESETSLSSSGGITETGDSEGSAFEGKVVDEEPLATPREESIAEQMQVHSREKFSGSGSGEFVAPEPSDSGAETQQEWPWKAVEFQEAVFSGSRFEPFLRNIGRVPTSFPSKAYEVPDFSNLEDTQSSVDKEQEDQDPPYEMSLAEIHTSPSDTKLEKTGEQLSILRLIESNMEFDGEEQQTPEQDDKEPKAVNNTDFIQKPSGEELSEAEVKSMDISLRRSLEEVLADKLVKVVALKSLLSKNIENVVSEKLSETDISQELEQSNLPNAAENLLGEREICLLKERKPSSGEKPDIKNLTDIVSQNLQAQLIGKLSEQQIIPDMGLAGNDQKVSFPSSGDLVKDLPKGRTSPTETTLKSLGQTGNGSKTESMQDSQEGQSVITKTDLSESKIDVSKSALPLKSHSSSLERINAKADFKTEDSPKPLEIIRVLLPSSTETELTQDKMEQLSKPEVSPKSSNDVLIENLLKDEIMSLKSCLSERFQYKPKAKDELPETGLRTKEDAKAMTQKLPLIMNGEHKMAPKKDLPQKEHISSTEGLAEATKEMPVLSGNIQNIVLEALSENEIASLNSILSEKTQGHLLERLSNIGLITEKELGKIVENLLSAIAKETPPVEVKGSDLPEEGQISSLTESLQDRFSEEELKNLKSLLSKLLKEGHRDRLSESEVKGLTTILQKSFEDLPIQKSTETGISKVVAIKDECHSIPLPAIEESTSTSANVEESTSTSANVGVSDRGKHRSKENNISSAGEKRGLRGENIDFSENSIFEMETNSKETQTSDLPLPPKKVKHSCKKECHRLHNYPDKQIPDMPNSKRGVESVLKSKPPEEPVMRLTEYPSSSFLSAHDIGLQTETGHLSKPLNYLPKPPFPVNPQTFLFLHSDPKEAAKLENKAHQKSSSKKKSDKSSKKGMASCYQSAMTNPQTRKEGGSSSKESLKEKGRKHTESPSPKQSMTENGKDSKMTPSINGIMRKESLKQKSEKKHNKEISPKKSLSKTFALSDLQQQNLPLAKNLPERSSTTKCPATSACAKGNTENPGESDDTDPEAFKHLEKAIERALLDLGRAPGGSPSQTSYSSRPHTTPSAALMPKESSRSLSTNNSATENPRNLTCSVTKMLENQEQITKMEPEQLAGVLRILQRILQQNTRSQSNG